MVLMQALASRSSSLTCLYKEASLHQALEVQLLQVVDSRADSVTLALAAVSAEVSAEETR